jgi:hypothetical protein
MCPGALRTAPTGPWDHKRINAVFTKMLNGDVTVASLKGLSDEQIMSVVKATGRSSARVRQSVRAWQK